MLPELFYNFMISKNMTGDISPDLESYTGEKIKYTMPLTSDDVESPDDYWHIPLLSIGDVHGNKNLCRISVQHTDPSVLYVAFRPNFRT